MATSRATQKLSELRQTLLEARTADDAERIHAALIDVVDGLITHAERQTRAIEDLRSDLTHKQGIVTNIKDRDFHGQSSSEDGREFYASSNGDRWFLGHDEGALFVTHQANQASGGATARVRLSTFLNNGATSPEGLALVQLLGTLVEKEL